jgi:uncharacterized iron-regulated membrane protein
MPTPAFWRQWHRWIGAPAALFMAYVSLTGVLLAANEFFGEEEAAREANRDVVSAIHTDSPSAAWTPALATAMGDAATRAPGAPVDKIAIELKGTGPRIMMYLGKPTGGEDRVLVYNGKTGAFLHSDGYEDKPLLARIHSGEIFGDGGLVGSMLWGLALLALTVSGFLLYWRLLTAKRPDRTGLKRFFF